MNYNAGIIKLLHSLFYKILYMLTLSTFKSLYYLIIIVHATFVVSLWKINTFRNYVLMFFLI